MFGIFKAKTDIRIIERYLDVHYPAQRASSVSARVLLVFSLLQHRAEVAKAEIALLRRKLENQPPMREESRPAWYPSVEREAPTATADKSSTTD